MTCTVTAITNDANVTMINFTCKGLKLVPE